MSTCLHHVADASAGLALETQLFGGAEPGALGWTARTRAIVCPSSYSRNRGFEGLASEARRLGWPITTRPTGGGAVPQGPGILNLAICYTAGAGHTIDRGYALLTDILRDGLSACGADISTGDTPQSFCDGAWNLMIDGRKLAGTAQRWKPLAGGRVRILAHAVLLADGDIGGPARAVAALHEHLGLPPVRPEAHITLREIQGADMDVEAIAARLCRSARARLEEEDGFRIAA